jgi:hypothetical protein
MKLISALGLLGACFLGVYAHASELSPVQTTQAWISAVKRNDSNAMMLLAFTPQEVLQHRSNFQDDCDAPKKWYDELGGNTQAVTAQLIEMTMPSLEAYDEEAKHMVLAAGQFLTALPEGQETNKTDQQALQRALQAWSERTDFTDPQRWMKSINVTIEQWEKLNVGIENCANETDKVYFKRLDHVWIALKAITRTYEFDIDKILASAKVRSGEFYTDDEGKKHAQVWISYQVFEAQVEMPVVLYQQDDQWFFDDLWNGW